MHCFLKIIKTSQILAIAALSGLSLVLHSLSLSLSPRLLAQNSYASYTYRLVNRKHISHILYESSKKEHFITLLARHRGGHAWYAKSHALYYPCPGPRQCMQSLLKLDRFLRTGQNMELSLKGSEIIGFRFVK